MRIKRQAGLNVALATTMVAAMTLTGCASGGSEASTDLPSAAPTSASPSSSPAASEPVSEYTPEEQAAIEKAKAAVVRFYEVSDAAFSDPKNAGADVFDDVAIDPVKSEELGVLGYYVAEDERATGRRTIEFAKVRTVKTESNPEDFVYPEVFFDICVDVSGTDVLDSSGKSVQGSGNERQPTILGAYEEPGEGWFVSHREYPQGGDACDR